MNSNLYTPSAFHNSDLATLLAFVRRYPFATLVTSDADGASVSHVPVLIRADPALTIYGHRARANAHWHQFDCRRARVIFHGPDSYISPSWYSSKEMVPTWNYAVVHASGAIAGLIREAKDQRVQLAELMKQDCGQNVANVGRGMANTAPSAVN